MTTEFPSLGWAAVDWIEHYLVHGPGDVQGQPIELDDEFTGFIVKAYRLHPKTGVRIVRRAFLSRAKGRAKSELAGMLDCFEALGPARFDHWAQPGEVSGWGYEYEPGEPVGAPLVQVEILNVATEEGQAGNTYDNAYYMLHPDTCSPELLADYGRIDVGLTRINLPNRRGSIETVTAANESKDGGKSTFIVADETHLWLPPMTGRFKLGKMHQTMARNLLKRKIASGWMLETSTMYAAGEGSVAEGTHAYAKSVAARGGKLLFDHRQAEDGFDFAKKSDRVKALRQAYGPAAAWMDLGEIADSYTDPQVDPREWERFWTNRPVPLEDAPDSVIGDSVWDASRRDPRSLEGMPSLAMAATPDLTFGAIGACRVIDGKRWVKVLAHGPGAGWLIEQAREFQRDYLSMLVLDKGGPCSSLIEPLQNAGVNLRLVGRNDVCDASAELVQAADEDRLRHMGEAELEMARKVAKWRWIEDRRAFGRRLGGDICPLEAVALAAWDAAQNDYDIADSVL